MQTSETNISELHYSIGFCNSNTTWKATPKLSVIKRDSFIPPDIPEESSASEHLCLRPQVEDAVPLTAGCGEVDTALFSRQ